jgi:hypothetical protein
MNLQSSIVGHATVYRLLPKQSAILINLGSILQNLLPMYVKRLSTSFHRISLHVLHIVFKWALYGRDKIITINIDNLEVSYVWLLWVE